MTTRARRPLSAAASRVVGAAWTVVAVPVGYLGVLTVAAWYATCVGRRSRGGADVAVSFAVLIPAHDEEEVLGETLAALSKLHEPAGGHRVYVVADHCSDRTIEIALAGGVEVLDHDVEPRGKGPALAWAIEHVLAASEPPDAIVVVDADTIVDPSLLVELERQFAAGALVVQGQYRVRDSGASPAAGLRAIALALRHHLRPLGRTALGGSSGLYGNGMAFRSSVLRGRSWSNHLTEDLELQTELLLDGIPVAYAPDAVVEAAMPSTLEASATQNARWERGRIELVRRYVPRLLRRAIEQSGRARVAAADEALDHLVPPLSVLVAAVGSLSVAELATSLAFSRRPRRAAVLLPVIVLFHVGSGIVLARVPLSVVRSLLHAPRMILWKVRLWSGVLGSGEGMPWVRTARS